MQPNNVLTIILQKLLLLHHIIIIQYYVWGDGCAYKRGQESLSPIDYITN